MKEFSREQIAEDEKVYLQLLKTKTRKEWAELYKTECRAKETRPRYRYTTDLFRDDMPCEGERVIFENSLQIKSQAYFDEH